MANVLGELFQEIADSIRTKTGKAEKLVPADFPSEILSIPITGNSGGGGGSGNSLKITSGSFKVTDETNVRQTIAHGLGEKPDFVCVWASGIAEQEITGATRRLISAWGLNSRFINSAIKGAFTSFMFAVDTSDGTYSEACWGVTESDYGMDNLPGSLRDDNDPWIYTPNDTTFQVGADSTFFFFPGANYSWIAMSGLGAGAANAEELSF